jgi:signal transduction histidine kinase
MFSSIRPGPPSETPRSGAAIVELDEFVEAADRPNAQLHVNLVSAAPGAAILLWGPEALCLAYNRHYRTLAALRVNALGRPLFKTQPDLEKTWKPRYEQALSGAGVTIDGAGFSGTTEGGSREIGWLMPVAGGDGVARGALGLFIDVSSAFEPLRRIVGVAAHDLRDPLIGVRVLAERLERAPKLSRERTAEDMARVLELTSQMEQIVDDMGAFARGAGASGGVRLNPIQSDLGAIVQETCDRLNQGYLGPIHVKVREAPGLWDPEAIRRVVTALCASARRHGPEGGEVSVEVLSGREGTMLAVKDAGSGPGGDLDQIFDPLKRVSQSPAERRRGGAGFGLFLARELVQAHGGRITAERPAHGGFVVRMVFPTPGFGGSSGGSGGSGLYRATPDRGAPPSTRGGGF